MRKKSKNPKEYKRKRRHMHIRHVVAGTEERPRVCVFRSNSNIYAQIIDDNSGRTLASVSSLKLPVPDAAAKPAEGEGEGKKKSKKGKKGGKKAKSLPNGVKMRQAKEVGRKVAEVAKDKGITKIRFDRGGYLYHGRVAALADAMREGGLEF
jgi:large subunit ribosomal protein L18